MQTTIVLGLLLVSGHAFAAPGDDVYAREQYNEAQQLKRQNQFDQARSLFEIVANLEAPEARTWGDLAADELRYGLLLQEAKYWLLKYGRSSHAPDQQDQYRRNAQRKFEEIIEANPDKPQRIIEAQQQLDQLAVSGGFLEASREANLFAALAPFRQSLAIYFQETGAWPDQSWVANELKQSLGIARLPTDKLIIQDYWKKSDSLYLILLDQSKNKKVTVKGDENGVYIEPGS